MQKNNSYKKKLLTEFVYFLFVQVGSLLIIVLLALASSHATAEKMICAIPTKNSLEKPEPGSYVKLLEAKTKFQFDESNRIKNFSSPGCHKVETVAFWLSAIEIGCNSNQGEYVNLKINLSTLKFDKTYMKNTKKLYSLSGFCLKPNN